ncbi:HvfC/BufC N-terminal domain-containing protein [Microvirga lotononidis]|nr:DNA-binding domain-containing protein [Microvirga lotononidis]WQO31905.1 DNA-binding domain-containing protein [Microvirga lotononidis]
MHSDIVCLTKVLATRFPVTRALVEDDVFRGMVQAFIALSPPRSPVTLTYGDDFGDFIDTFPLVLPVPYLGDMARLEAARTRAHYAADASPLTVRELAAFAPHSWEQCLAVLHPSVQVVRSTYPIVTIWETYVAKPQGKFDNSRPEDALIARPDLVVEIHRLPPGGAVFIQHLMNNSVFRDAADKAAVADPRFDLVTSLSVLLSHHLIIGLNLCANQ